MKLNQEELELRVLKHVITDQSALERTRSMGVTKNHFCFMEEGITVSYTRNLFGLAYDYYEKSNGYLMTQFVLEDKLVQEKVDDAKRGKYLVFWAKVQDQEYDKNDLYELLTDLKARHAVRLWKKMQLDGHAIMSERGLDVGISFMQEKLNEIAQEASNQTKEQEKIDLADVKEYFEKEYFLRLNNPDKFRGVPCGNRLLDEKTYGWMPGQVVLVLAPSSGGKSVQMLNWAHYAHAAAGKKVLYFSFEMPLWLCVMRHLSLAFRVPYYKLKGVNLETEALQNLMERLSGLKGGPYFEYDVSMTDPTPEYVEARIQELIATKGKPDLVVADYIGNMTTRNARKDAPPWEKQGNAFEKLFQIARRYELPILTAQQINRDTIRETRKQKQAGKATAFYQDAASGDQRMMHLCHYAIGIDPDKENNMLTYYGVKMRDAYFDPFGADVMPEHNGIYEMTPDRVAEWRRLNHIDGDGSSESGVKNAPRIVQSDKPSEVKVEWAGVSTSIQDEDLVLDANDWDLNG